MKIAAVYENVTRSIIAELEQGAAPWVKPGRAAAASAVDYLRSFSEKVEQAKVAVEAIEMTRNPASLDAGLSHGANSNVAADW